MPESALILASDATATTSTYTRLLIDGATKYGTIATESGRFLLRTVAIDSGSSTSDSNPDRAF